MNKISSLFIVSCMICPVYADTDHLDRVLSDGKVNLDFRYRYEYVDQNGLAEEAGASTLRSRISIVSGELSGWTAGLEADYIAVVGSERYNSTENGRADYPVVADPEGFDLNQAYLRYRNDAFTFTGGRQRITHAHQRFLGGVAWRQNEQTYDAARFQSKIANTGITLDYSYVWNVNRIFGPNDGAQPADWRSDSHIILANWGIQEGHTVQAFAYLLDFDNDNGLPNSAETYGLRYSGKFGRLGVNASYATQSDYGNSPFDYKADYLSLGISANLDEFQLSAGFEVLGSDDGLFGFRTPLATLHKFQGWTDKFLITPATGMRDASLGVSRRLGKFKVALAYHEFEADVGGMDYGDEVNLVGTYAVSDGASLQFKYADYRADEFATDTVKFWLTLHLTI
ncbi:MAG: porin [Pseudomonadota bacterium]